MALPAGQYLGGVGGVQALSTSGSAHGREAIGLAPGAPLGRTPWVDKSMERVWERLTPHVDEAWLPELDGDALKVVRGIAQPTFSVQEYGCGYYGCVLPTRTEGLVLKVTSDASEAMFAQGAINLREWPLGMVQYKKVIALAGEKRKRRNLFLLWREEAHDIGFPQFGAFGALRTNLRSFKSIAQTARRVVSRSANAPKLLQEADSRYGDWAAEVVQNYVQDRGEYITANTQYHYFKGAQLVALCHRMCIYFGELMQSTPNQVEVGEALSFYAQQNILLADVHEGNVGRREEPNGDFMPVITDPGQAVPMNLSWLSVSIQVV